MWNDGGNYVHGTIRRSLEARLNELRRYPNFIDPIHFRDQSRGEGWKLPIPDGDRMCVSAGRVKKVVCYGGKLVDVQHPQINLMGAVPREITKDAWYSRVVLRSSTVDGLETQIEARIM